MIFTLQNADPRVRTQLQSFTRILPVPQFLAWENAAAQFIKKGFRLEAAMLIDLAMRHYGKDVGRASFERLSAQQEAAGEELFKNPRNAAAGSLRQKENAASDPQCILSF